MLPSKFKEIDCNALALFPGLSNKNYGKMINE